MLLLYIALYLILQFKTRFFKRLSFLSRSPATHDTCTTHFSPLHLEVSAYVTVMLLILKAITPNEAYPNHRQELWRFVTHCEVLH